MRSPERRAGAQGAPASGRHSPAGGGAAGRTPRKTDGGRPHGNAGLQAGTAPQSGAAGRTPQRQDGSPPPARSPAALVAHRHGNADLQVGTAPPEAGRRDGLPSIRTAPLQRGAQLSWWRTEWAYGRKREPYRRVGSMPTRACGPLCRPGGRPSSPGGGSRADTPSVRWGTRHAAGFGATLNDQVWEFRPLRGRCRPEWSCPGKTDHS